MTVYTYAEAISSADEVVDILDIQIFKTLEEALAYKDKQKRKFLDDEDDEWVVEFGDDFDARNTYLSCGEDEVALVVVVNEVAIND